MTQYRQRVEAGEHGELQEPVNTQTNQPAEEPVEEDEGLSSLTVEELRQRAAEADIEGRSSMNKDQLVEALS